jgi:hypothetical protein
MPASIERFNRMNTLKPTESVPMHPNQELVQRFFQCFAGGDHRGMRRCLHPDVAFSDIGFDLTGAKVGAMWQMICAKGTQIMFRNVQADDSQGTAHWECHYDFQKDEGAKAHSVHNVIESRFVFEGGLIREHHDSCDFERWARQALGVVGLVLGETEFLHKQVREAAAKKLETFIAAHPDSLDIGDVRSAVASE